MAALGSAMGSEAGTLSQQRLGFGVCWVPNVQGKSKEPRNKLYLQAKIKGLQGCTTQNHDFFFFFSVMNTLTECAYKLLPNIQHIFNIKDLRTAISFK